MIVCHCAGITDRDIRSLVRQGRAKTVSEIGLACESAAGRGCGGCQLAVQQIVRQEERSRAEGSLTGLVSAL